MFRRTFVKSLMATCSIPLWPFPLLKEKLSNSDYIKKLLKEGKDFSISNKDEEWQFNIIRRRKQSDIVTQMQKTLLDRIKHPEKYLNPHHFSDRDKYVIRGMLEDKRSIEEIASAIRCKTKDLRIYIDNENNNIKKALAANEQYFRWDKYPYKKSHQHKVEIKNHND